MEEEGVSIDIMEAILEVAFDLYTHNAYASFSLANVRRHSPMFSLPILTEVLRQGYNLGIFIVKDSGLIMLSQRINDAFEAFAERLFDEADPDLFFAVYGISRHVEEFDE